MTPLGRSFAILVSAVLGAACSLHVDDFKPGAAAGDSAVGADTSVDDSSVPSDSSEPSDSGEPSDADESGETSPMDGAFDGDTGCLAGKTLCPSGCVDLKVPDNNNCGMCGVICTAPKACKAAGTGTGASPQCK